MAVADFKIQGTLQATLGYDTTAGAVLNLQLENAPGLDSARVVYSIIVKSKSTPDPVFSPADGRPTTPTGIVTCTMPGSGVHSVELQCQVNEGRDAAGKVNAGYTRKRIISIRSGVGRRKIVPAESTTYSATGWTDAQNEDVDLAGAGIASVGATAPITSTGGANPVIGIPAASGATAGSMSIADFNKLAGLPSSAVPTSRQIISGTGLTGGGDLSADRTLNVGAGTYIIANANDVAVDGTPAATADKVLVRGSSAEAVAAWFAPSGSVATTGTFRGVNNSDLVVGHTTNTVCVAISGGTVVVIGANQAQTPSAAVVLVKPSNEVQLDPNTTGRFMTGGGTRGTWTSSVFDFLNPVQVDAINEHTAAAGVSVDAAQMLLKDGIASVLQLFLGATPSATRNYRLYKASANVVATTATVDTITLPTNTGHLICVFGIARNAGRVYAFIKATHASRFAGAAAVGATVVLLDQQTAGGSGWIFDFNLSSPDVRLQLNSQADTVDVDLYVLLLRHT